MKPDDWLRGASPNWGIAALSSSNIAYRNDIDGLRAIAVLLVTVFHIDESLIPGGFLGVDMFFVISGYLITGNIVRSHRFGQFSYLEFYRKRFRRILPAMLAVTTATWMVGVAVMLPKDAEQLSWATIATVFSAANIYFTYYLDTSYFAADSATIPLLHMWSLGIEEQFYIIWPAFLILILRVPRLGSAAIVLTIATSVAVGELQLQHDSFGWAYYMLPARAFELASGGLLAFVGIPAFRPRDALLLSFGGAIVVTLSVMLLSGSTRFPGINAVPVTVGIVALIAGCKQLHPLSYLLSLRPLRWIGRISYSLYLWHWPVLALQRYFTPELSIIQECLSAAIMVALADLTYRWVEVPFRRTEWSFHETLMRFYVFPGAAISAASAVIIMTAGFGPWMITDYPARLTNSTKAAFSYDFVCQQSQLTPDIVTAKRCVSGNLTGEPRVLLYGDSNAAHFVGAFRVLADAYGFSFRNVAHSACPPVQLTPHRFASERYRARCLNSHRVVDPAIGNFPVVALAAAWDSYDKAETNSGNGGDFRSALVDLIRALKRNGQRIILIGVIPKQGGFDRDCAAKSIKFPILNCQAETSESEPAINFFLRKLASEEEGVSYMNPFPAVCSMGKCRAYDGSISLYYDPGHLSMEGSRVVGQYWLRNMSPELLSTLTIREETSSLKVQ